MSIANPSLASAINSPSLGNGDCWFLSFGRALQRNLFFDVLTSIYLAIRYSCTWTQASLTQRTPTHSHHFPSALTLHPMPWSWAKKIATMDFHQMLGTWRKVKRMKAQSLNKNNTKSICGENTEIIRDSLGLQAFHWLARHFVGPCWWKSNTSL